MVSYLRLVVLVAVLCSACSRSGQPAFVSQPDSPTPATSPAPVINVVQSPNGTFDRSLRGQVGSFHYTSPTDGVPRTILYYFPKSIESVKPSATPRKTLMFMHGGGSSTTTDAGATSVATRYIADFLQYSEDRQVILIFPTTSFGWSGHTRHFFRNFVPYVKSKLAVDSDHLVLAGHSMGGMGITREYPFMTDLFSGVLGLSAGTQSFMYTDDMVLPYLNGTPYTHINGDDDHFTEFKPDMLAFQKALNSVEERYQHKSKFQLIFRPGGHSYVLPQVLSELDKLYLNHLNRYPKYFEVSFGVAHYAGDPVHYAASPKIDAVVDQQFWIKAEGLKLSDPNSGMYLMGDVKGQVITLTSKEDSLHPKQFTLSLTNDLVNLSLPVQVIYDGKVVFNDRLDDYFDDFTGMSATLPIWP